MNLTNQFVEAGQLYAIFVLCHFLMVVFFLPARYRLKFDFTYLIYSLAYSLVFFLVFWRSNFHPIESAISTLFLFCFTVYISTCHPVFWCAKYIMKPAEMRMPRKERLRLITDSVKYKVLPADPVRGFNLWGRSSAGKAVIIVINTFFHLFCLFIIAFLSVYLY